MYLKAIFKGNEFVFLKYKDYDEYSRQEFKKL